MALAIHEIEEVKQEEMEEMIEDAVEDIAEKNGLKTFPPRPRKYKKVNIMAKLMLKAQRDRIATGNIISSISSCFTSSIS